MGSRDQGSVVPTRPQEWSKPRPEEEPEDYLRWAPPEAVGRTQGQAGAGLLQPQEVKAGLGGPGYPLTVDQAVGGAGGGIFLCCVDQAP